MTKTSQHFTRRYIDALRVRLETRRPAGTAASELGMALRKDGLKTSDLAQVHGCALITLSQDHDFNHPRAGQGRKAASFFNETLASLGAASRPVCQSLVQTQQRASTLVLHAAALALSNRKLKREITRRKVSAKALKLGRERYQLLLTESQSMQKKLRSLAHQILSAQEDERREISRELHDEVVQTLVGINVQLASLGRSASLGAKTLRSKIASTQRLVERSVNAVHQFARELRPAVLDDLGLIPALHAYMKTLAVRKKFRIDFTATASAEDLSGNKRTVLYRVAQEALMNIARHAHAVVVTVSLREIPHAIRLEVHDDGRSFSVEQVLSTKTNKRLGLLGMRERVEMVGGQLTIVSSLGNGTTVRADIPFSNPRTRP
jgi:signal transduction histidine kinase